MEERSEPASAEGKKEHKVVPEANLEKPENVLVSFGEFQKIELKVGQIMLAERIEKSEKLIRLEVDVGDEEGPRQIVAGIAKHYEAEVLVGRKIVVVANLKPAKLMGYESRGMVLAASDDAGNLELVSVGSVIPVGSRVS